MPGNSGLPLRLRTGMISPVAPYDNTGDPTQVGEPDGHGLFGVLDEDVDGLLCHICGWRGPHLGLHAYKGHGMRARQYKLEHGLRRSKGLVPQQCSRGSPSTAQPKCPHEQVSSLHEIPEEPPLRDSLVGCPTPLRGL